MRVDRDASSKWLSEVEDAIGRCKQVLLYGNVDDQFLWNGSYVTAREFLKRHLASDHGYEIVAHYDVADGLVFADSAASVDPQSAGAGMRQRFEEIVRRGMVTDSPDLASAAEPQALVTGAAPGNGTPPRGIPGARAPRRSDRGYLATQPLEAISRIRMVMNDNSVPSAFILCFADMFVTNPERQGDDERRMLIHIRRAMDEAAFVLNGARRNALVLMAPSLSGVPEWAYKDSPFVKVIQASRPGKDERIAFVEKYGRNFHGDLPEDPDEARSVYELFGDLTDGLSAWDLDAIRRTSLAESLPLAQPRELVNFFKYGRPDDPWEQMNEAKVREASEAIGKRVIGQPAAVEAVTNMLISAKVGVTMSPVTAAAGKPKGVFFFVGPTGVGKTELAKALTAEIFGDDSAFARFDMSEYAEQHAAEKLTGSPPGFVGYEEGGHLTNRVQSHPFSLLLFDEIEKAHPKIMDKFLQILEDGRLTDGKGQTAYFNQSVIIFTSNLGSSELRVGAELPSYAEVQAHFRHAVEAHFRRPARADGTGGLGRPELYNRLGEGVVVFDLLRPEHIEGITRKFLGQLSQSAEQKRGLQPTWDPSVYDWVALAMREGDNMLYGGRRIKTLLETGVEKPLNRWIFFTEPSAGSDVLATMSGEPPELHCNGTPARGGM